MDHRILRVLIVENDPERLKVFADIFRHHAWISVNTVPKAKRYLSAFQFDVIMLDYDLEQGQKSSELSALLLQTQPPSTRIFLHAMNSLGREELQSQLPSAKAIPFSRLTRDNRTVKQLRNALDAGIDFDWSFV